VSEFGDNGVVDGKGGSEGGGGVDEIEGERQPVTTGDGV